MMRSLTAVLAVLLLTVVQDAAGADPVKVKCSAYTCPEGFVADTTAKDKECANNICTYTSCCKADSAFCTDTTCCEKVYCGLYFKCPQGNLLSGADKITCANGTCDEATCCDTPACAKKKDGSWTNYSCTSADANAVLKANPEKINCVTTKKNGAYVCTDVLCCAMTCNSYSCGAAALPNPGTIKCDGACTKDKCCYKDNCKTQSSVCNDAAYAVIANPENIACSADGTDKTIPKCNTTTCCSKSNCGDFAGCLGSTVKKDSPEKIGCNGACSIATCCKKAPTNCTMSSGGSSYDCKMGFPKPKADLIACTDGTCDDAQCCEKRSCTTFDCAALKLDNVTNIATTTCAKDCKAVECCQNLPVLCG